MTTPRGFPSPVVMLALLASVFLPGCGDDAALRTTRHRADSLAAMLAVAQAQLDSLKTQPDRLIALARQSLAANRPEDAVRLGRQLLATHPEAPEAVIARQVVQQGEALVAAAAAEARRAHEDSVRAAASRIARAMAGMRKKHDDVRGITWYTDASVPVSPQHDRRLYLYIGKDDDGSAPFLRFVIRYSGDDWLFIDRYLIKTDARTFTLVPDDYGSDAVERDNGYGGIWEWWDVRTTSEHRELVDAILASKGATIRYEGKQYYMDRTITATERAALRLTLDAFAALSGQR